MQSKRVIVYAGDALNGDLAKLRSIMVMDALVSGSALACARLGADSSRLNQERKLTLGVW